MNIPTSGEDTEHVKQFFDGLMLDPAMLVLRWFGNPHHVFEQL